MTEGKKERANAFNRFYQEFLKEFLTADYGIDWEKLLRFNSGKEPYPKQARD